MLETSICIVTMNRPDKLAETLRSIEGTAVDPYEIVIVDNGSTDPAQLELLHEWRNKAWIVRNETNQGLSNATNQGFEAAHFPVLIHLDDDVLFSKQGWNQDMARLIERRGDVGMVIPTKELIAIPNDGFDEILWGLGMCWAMRKELFDDIGGYDPQLYHQNECDMGLRVRMAGYKVAAIQDFFPLHNDPDQSRTPYSKARERIGCVQFRDKWASYFRGRDWNYGTDPIYLMQHWPPDQEFMRRWALHEGVNLNPAPGYFPTSHDPVEWEKLDHMAMEQKINIKGLDFLVFRDLRNDYAHWEWQFNPGVYERDRTQIIEDWLNMTGERYEGYKWPHNLLRPY